MTFFAFEWVDSHIGKVMKEIRARASTVLRRNNGAAVNSNAVLIKAISRIDKRPFPFPVEAMARTTGP
jgi:hypothetical protein